MKKLKVLREENWALIAEKSTLTEIRVGLGRSEDYAGSKRDFRRGGVSKKEYEGIVCRISCPSREEKIALAKEIVKIKQQEI